MAIRANRDLCWQIRRQSPTIVESQFNPVASVTSVGDSAKTPVFGERCKSLHTALAIVEVSAKDAVYTLFFNELDAKLCI